MNNIDWDFHCNCKLCCSNSATIFYLFQIRFEYMLLTGSQNSLTIRKMDFGLLYLLTDTKLIIHYNNPHMTYLNSTFQMIGTLLYSSHTIACDDVEDNICTVIKNSFSFVITHAIKEASCQCLSFNDRGEIHLEFSRLVIKPVNLYSIV